MTSSEIAQLFAAQTQMFTGQAQYAQQIGTSNPATSIGSYGTPQGMGAQQMNMPGFRPPPRPISFAPSGFGSASYGPGTQFAGHAMSAAGGAASMFTSGSMREAAMGVGITGAFGGVAGGLAGTGIMAGAGAAMLPALPVAAAAYGAGKLLNTFMGGGQQQQMIQSQLGQFGHINPASRTGSGFSRDDAMAIGNSIRSLANIPEMMTSVEELTRMIPKLKSMGVMQGVRDASEFSARFRETVKTARDVSKLLGTTLEEAGEFLAHSRGVGFMGRQTQIQNVLSTQFTSGLTGMTMGQTMGMQAGGAAMARQVGGKGSQGATAVTNIAQRIAMAQQSGRISEEMIQDVTGQSGAEGVGAASQRMYELMLNMRNSSAGRLIMAGAMKKDSSGKVVLDDDAIKKLNNGELGVDDLKRKASRLSDEDKISFMYRAQGSLGAQFAGSVDIGSFMQRLVGNRGRDAAARVLQMQGIGGNENDIDMLMQMGGGPGAGEKRSFAERQARESYISQQTDPSKILAKVKTRLFTGSGMSAVRDTGAKAFNEIGKAYDEFVDDLVGRQVVSISKEGAERLHRAFVSTNRGDLKKLFGEAYGVKGEGLAQLSRPGRGGVGGGFSTVGGAIGGIAGAMLAPITGGASLGLGSNMIGEAINKLLGTGNLRDTEAWAKLTGDRSATAQVRRQGELFGGASPEELARAGMGTGARNAMINIAGKIEGFGEKSDTEKLDALRDATSKVLGQGGLKGELAKSADEMKRKFGEKVDPAAAMVMASGLVNSKGLANKSDLFATQNAEALATNIRDATNAVTRALEVDGATLVKNKPEARRLLMDMQDKPELAGILLGSGSDEEKLKKLREMEGGGYNIDQGDIHQILAAHQKMKAGDGADIKKSISRMVLSQAQGDINVLKKNAGDAAGGTEDAALKSALMHYAESGVDVFDEGKDSAKAGVESAVADLVKKASATTNEKSRNRIIESAGKLRDAVAAGVGATKMVGMTAAQLQRLGFSEEDLSSIGLTGNKKVTADMVGKLQKVAEGGKLAGVLGGAGSAITSGDRDTKLLKLLDQVSRSIDGNTTVLQVAAGLIKPDEAKQKLKALSEVPPTDDKGKTAPSKKEGG